MRLTRYRPSDQPEEMREDPDGEWIYADDVLIDAVAGEIESVDGLTVTFKVPKGSRFVAGRYFLVPCS